MNFDPYPAYVCSIPLPSLFFFYGDYSFLFLIRKLHIFVVCQSFPVVLALWLLHWGRKAFSMQRYLEVFFPYFFS